MYSKYMPPQKRFEGPVSVNSSDLPCRDVNGTL